MAKSENKTETTTSAPAFEPTIKNKLVVPQLKLVSHQAVYFQAMGKMYIGKANPEKPDDKAADLCRVRRIPDNAEFTIVIPAILKSVWDGDFADHKQIGLGFMVTKGDKVEGKRYFSYDVSEIEVPADMLKANADDVAAAIKAPVKVEV